MTWDYFDKFEEVIAKYLPVRGEGENKASQITTAINKLIFKWYNDGDVFDNRYYLEGWVNDLSSYANWLAENVEGADPILDGIVDCESEEDYECLLVDLADSFLIMDYLDKEAKFPVQGSIYKCKGKYEFVENEDEEEDW